jgi:Transposase IS66 family
MEAALWSFVEVLGVEPTNNAAERSLRRAVLWRRKSLGTKQECRAANLDFLTRLFLLLWGPIERPLSSADLLAFNFDDSKEPQLSDYYDEM